MPTSLPRRKYRPYYWTVIGAILFFAIGLVAYWKTGDIRFMHSGNTFACAMGIASAQLAGWLDTPVE